jgi:hypothetical protein
MLMQRSETRVVPENELSRRSVVVKYVGELEKTVSRSGINHGTTHFSGGYGIGIENDVDRDEMMLRLRPVIYVPFASILGVTLEKAAEVKRAGTSLSIALYQGEIATASAAGRELMTYGEYVSRVEHQRSFWMLAAAITAFAAVLVFGISMLAASTRDALP